MDTRVDFRDQLHPNLQLCLASRPRDPQRWAFAVDAPRPLNGFSVHNNSLTNLLRGLNERVFYTDNCRTEPVKPRDEAFSTLLNPFTNKLRSYKIPAWTLEQVRDSYTGSQLSRYTRAYDSLLLMPLNRRDYKVSTFVKCEKINFGVKVDPAPRVIQPRDPRFGLTLAQYIKPLEPLIYKALGELYEFPCVAKGFDVFQTGDIFKSKWNMFKNPCAIGMDASRFDQHCSVDALKWTHSVYKRFNNSPEFSKLLDAMLHNKGHGSCKDGFVKYEVEGRRMSGDMDTALGNCVLMVAMTYSLAKSLGIKHEVMDNGDDLCIIMEQSEADRFKSAVPTWFQSLGFNMKVEQTVFQLEQIEFCQMHPVYDGCKWRMVRNLVALAKDLVCTTGQHQVAKWLEAIGQGGMSLCSGIPVYQEFYTWLKKFGVGRNNTKNSKAFMSSGFSRLARLSTDSTYKPVSIEARESFGKAFGMNFSQQLSLESVYKMLGTGPLDISTTQFNCLTEFNQNSSFLF